jgi:hypothetical protein
VDRVGRSAAWPARSTGASYPSSGPTRRSRLRPRRRVRCPTILSTTSALASKSVPWKSSFETPPWIFVAPSCPSCVALERATQSSRRVPFKSSAKSLTSTFGSASRTISARAIWCRASRRLHPSRRGRLTRRFRRGSADRVLFMSTHALVQCLLAAKGDLRLGRRAARAGEYSGGPGRPSRRARPVRRLTGPVSLALCSAYP